MSLPDPCRPHATALGRRSRSVKPPVLAALHVRAADGDGNRQAGARVFSPVGCRNSQVRDRLCKPICKPDAAGQAETGEMQKAGGDFTPQVDRGQRGDQRLPETAETHVVWLITQRSEVQILPPLPGPEALSRAEKRASFVSASSCICKKLHTRSNATSVALWQLKPSDSLYNRKTVPC